MTMFILQSAILLAIAFAAGAVIGCLARRQLHKRPEEKLAITPPPKAIPAPIVEPKPPAAPEPAPAPVPAIAGSVASPRKRAASRKSAKPAAAVDDLKKISGIGRASEGKLNAAGVTSFAQVAAWKPAEQKEWGEKLGFPGRVEREDWVGQAKLLSSGGATAFAKRVDKGEVPSSAAAGSDAAKASRKPRRKQDRK